MGSPYGVVLKDEGCFSDREWSIEVMMEQRK